MTTSLKFNSLEEYIEYITTSKTDICSCILQGIENGLLEKDDNPEIFKFSIGKDSEDQNAYSMFLDKKEWITGLSNCLRIFTDDNRSDDAIDTYLLIKKIYNEWGMDVDIDNILAKGVEDS